MVSDYCPNCERLQEQLHREHEEQDKVAARLCAEEEGKSCTYTILGVTYLIRVSRDGDQWSALVGENLQEGLAGFGPDIATALRKLADEWELYGFELAPREENHG